MFSLTYCRPLWHHRGFMSRAVCFPTSYLNNKERQRYKGGHFSLRGGHWQAQFTFSKNLWNDCFLLNPPQEGAQIAWNTSKGSANDSSWEPWEPLMWLELCLQYSVNEESSVRPLHCVIWGTDQRPGRQSASCDLAAATVSREATKLSWTRPRLWFLFCQQLKKFSESTCKWLILFPSSSFLEFFKSHLVLQ